MASNEGSNSSNPISSKKKGSFNPALVAAPISQPTPYGVMPKLPADDDKVDWMRT